MTQSRVEESGTRTDAKVLGFIDYVDLFERNTRTSYLVFLSNYLIFIYPELGRFRKQIKGGTRITHDDETDKAFNQASIKYVTDGRDYKADLIAFRKDLTKQGKSPHTLGASIAGIVGFLGRNGIELNKYDQRDLSKGLNKTLIRDKVPTADQLAKLISFMPIQGKTLVYLLSSTGMRISEALQLCVEDLSLDKDPASAEVIDNGQDRTVKNGESRRVLIGKEAVGMLKDWLAYRPEFLKKGGLARGGDYDPNSTRVFPFTDENFQAIWTIAVEKAGLGEKDKRTGRLLVHPHSLRKYFRTRGQWKNTDIAEFLMGHLTGLGGIYDRLDQNWPEVEEEYRHAEKFLSIHEGSRNMLDLKDKVEKQKSENDELLKNFTLKNAKLENELFEMKVTMASNFDKFIEIFQQEQGAWIQHETKLRAEIDQLRIVVPPEEMKPLDFTLSEPDKVAIEELKVLALQRSKR